MGSRIGVLPPVKEWLADCPQAWLFPNAGGWDPLMDIVEPFYDNYEQVRDDHLDYQDVVDKHGTYLGLLDPFGFNPSTFPASGAGGLGWVGGVVTHGGVEVWLTEVSGWDDGAALDAKTMAPGLLAGTHVTSVLGRGRTIEVKGSLFDPSGGGALPMAQKYLAAGLATPPHRGWLTIDGLWLPVAMSGVIKQRWVDAQRVDFEFTLRGRDGVSPGDGVYREKRPSQIEYLTDGETKFLGNFDGFIGVYPLISWWPTSESATATLRFTVPGGGASSEIRLTSGGIGTGFDPDVWLQMDGGHRRVDVMSIVDSEIKPVASGRGNIVWSQSEWLEIPPGGIVADLDVTAGSGSVDIEWVQLS